MSTCPVCRNEGRYFFDYRPKDRVFLICDSCTLVFQEWNTLPDAGKEKERYELHRNNPRDTGYLKWLESFIETSFIPWYKGGSVLDFGSGPSPVLTDLLREKGIDVTSYDPFFYPRWPEKKRFSLILLCEVLEHIHNPVQAFRDLSGIASEDAVLSLKTQFLPSLDQIAFQTWWYKEDPTHIRFYNPLSLKNLGKMSGWDLIHHDSSSLAVFKKRRYKGEN